MIANSPSTGCLDAHGILHDLVLERFHGVERAHAHVTCHRDCVRSGAEHPLEAIHSQLHGNVSLHTLVLILLQEVLAREVLTALHALNKEVAESVHVTQTKVQSLTGKRVDRVGRVAHKGNTRLDVLGGVLQLKREGEAVAHRGHSLRWGDERLRQSRSRHDGVGSVVHTLHQVREHRDSRELRRHGGHRWGGVCIIKTCHELLGAERRELLGHVGCARPHHRRVSIAHGQ
ncbi:hypothetical protein F442_12295 [Phytophthora nicotianae P10297]|uniref:Uncharacterized protein n=1 Tax=Phytophthora nicotianae P10297 TaxID=1317064 RepID=W2YZ99_PHYNI|nr:hypothetical protein F442_12295 [Phytophthora nicotianae P10297]